MFNFSNNRRDQIREHLSSFQDDYNKEQKAAIMMAIAGVAQADGNVHPKEIKNMEETSLMLGIEGDEPIFRQIASKGIDEIIRILNTLERNQKEWFITALHGMIHADNRVEDSEIAIALTFANEIGISDHEYRQIIEKTNQLMKLFMDQ